MTTYECPLRQDEIIRVVRCRMTAHDMHAECKTCIHNEPEPQEAHTTEAVRSRG